MTNEQDPLDEYRRRRWPAACFPAGTGEAEAYRFVLWHYIADRDTAARRALRPRLALRLVVRARWCGLGLRTVWRLVRLMLVLDGTLPTRARWARRRREG